MLIIGLTGGIGCGKSTVSQIIKNMGAGIVDADLISMAVLEKGQEAYTEVVKAFGTDILETDGNINRKALGNIIFSDEDKRELLEDITHPKIIKEIENQIEICCKEGVELIIIDAPLLIEADMQDMVDRVWLVTVPENIQIERLMKRDNCTAEGAMARIKAQMPFEEKEKYANVVICNDRTKEDLEQYLKDLIRREIIG